MTKTDIENQLKPALNFNSYFTEEAKARRPSPLKKLLKYIADKDNIYLASGLPRPDTFPIEKLSFTAKHPVTNEVQSYTITQTSGMVPLNLSQQYGNGLGTSPFRELLYNLTKQLQPPQYSNWNVVPTVGNTDALCKILGLFVKRGDPLIVARWSYPSALETFIALGIELIIVDIDDEGIVPESMEHEVMLWNQAHPDKPCRSVYVVPCGQNPTGATMSLNRRHHFYKVCQNLDLLIFEDDPYYFLQLPEYDPNHPLLDTNEPDNETLLSRYSFNSLLPTLSHLDTEGRVLRMESVAKFLAPGFRCGWIVAQQPFIDKLQYSNELSCQFPSAYSQSILTELLNETSGWGLKGLELHLAKLRFQFHLRRDLVVKELIKHVGKRVSFAVPNAGMFLWIQPKLPSHLLTLPNQLPTQATMSQLFNTLIDTKVVVVPGHCFDTLLISFENQSQEQRDAVPGAPYLRLCFTYAELDQVLEGVRRIGKALNALE